MPKKQARTSSFQAFTHNQSLPLQQYGLEEEIGEENIFGNIDDALDRAREMLGMKKEVRTRSFVPSVEREK